MKYLNEVLKLIQHGVAGNTDMVRDYALLLADKLVTEGSPGNADAVRKSAYGVPPAPEEIVTLPEQPGTRKLAEENANDRTRAIVLSRVEIALSLPQRLELADPETGKPLAGGRKRALFIRGFHEIAAGMGVDRFAEVPVTVLNGFMIMTIIKNHDTRGLLKSLVNSFMVAYCTPETSEAAFKSLVSLEGLRAKIAHDRHISSSHAGLRAAADSLSLLLRARTPGNSSIRPAFNVLVGVDRLYVMAASPIDDLPSVHEGFPVEFMQSDLTGIAHGRTDH